MFELDNNQVIISPENLALPFFKTIWDKEKDKSEAFKQLSYIFYLVDHKSPYANYPEKERKDKVIKDILKVPNFKESKELSFAIEKYKELTSTTSTMLLDSVKNVLYKLKEYFDDVVFSKSEDPDETARKVLLSVASVGKALESLANLEEKVKKELTQKGKRRGSSETAEYET